ncbi:pyridoxamine 5'-phosphate oxidase family protein [Candidatus Halobonum tyrrellensis]|uniref:Putative flavin-nucleotide-binding protein n=1 Tax=Candidatus Halobonum tyrrellensis G22 TaxID=1324957 RepID=V4HLM6_9EURY|nr:pyridoxamine 5'-phosphate oxidase family protein [Candidatus Halobonum tyrrellensis]ESP88799.1 putative flavin-nucleotide-binding protein [Candidatus Halobonum tyrrellensis G22]
MQGLRWVQLSTTELDGFLGSGGTGVLSLGTDPEDSPFAVPVSYGYDPETRAFYFRLSVPEGSGKREYVDRPVTFVVHDRVDDRWRSAVATGRLRDVSEADADSALLAGLWAVDIPEVDVFDRPPEEVEFRHYRLAPETLTGRKEVAASA